MALITGAGGGDVARISSGAVAIGAGFSAGSQLVNLGFETARTEVGHWAGRVNNGLARLNNWGNPVVPYDRGDTGTGTVEDVSERPAPAGHYDRPYSRSQTEDRNHFTHSAGKARKRVKPCAFVKPFWHGRGTMGTCRKIKWCPETKRRYYKLDGCRGRFRRPYVFHKYGVRKRVYCR